MQAERVSWLVLHARNSTPPPAGTFVMAEEELIKEIRESFVSDGVRWAVEPERKLIHLWKKLKRTEDYLRRSAQETEALKAQQKEHLNNVQELLANVRRLGEEKDALTHSLEEENSSLRERCEQVEAERDAFIEENQVIAKCLVEAGLQRFAGPTPRQPVELLIKEWQESQHRLTKLEGEAAISRQTATEQEAVLERKVKELEGKYEDAEARLGQEMDRVKAMVKERETLEGEVYMCCYIGVYCYIRRSSLMQVSSTSAELQQEKERLVAVKADHVKQHKLNQKQIHDLHSKIRRSEVWSRA